MSREIDKYRWKIVKITSYSTRNVWGLVDQPTTEANPASCDLPDQRLEGGLETERGDAKET